MDQHSLYGPLLHIAPLLSFAESPTLSDSRCPLAPLPPHGTKGWAAVPIPSDAGNLYCPSDGGG